MRPGIIFHVQNAGILAPIIIMMTIVEITTAIGAFPKILMLYMSTIIGQI
jgi:hypothetical protein